MHAVISGERHAAEEAAALAAARRAEEQRLAEEQQAERMRVAAERMAAEQAAAVAEQRAQEQRERQAAEQAEAERAAEEARLERGRLAAEAKAAALAAAQVALASQAAPVIEAAALDSLLCALIAEAMASWRAGKSCERSAEAKARRRQKRKRHQPAAAAQTVGTGAAAGTGVQHHNAQSDAAVLAAENQALRGQLAQKSALLVLARKQKKRADNTSRQRGQQLKVRSSKEQKRLARRFGAKQQRAIEGAARREAVRVRKRKQPAGEILHSSERKHQCLLGKGSGGGGKGRGKGGGRGGGFGRGSHGRA